MSWLFSQALVAEFSAATSWAGAPSAQLNVMPTPQPFWRNDKTMEPSQLSRFGLTSALLTEDHGAALLTWFQAGFLARTSALQDQAPASMENAPASGRTWPGLLAKFDPATSSWKTAQCSFLVDSDEFSETWPRSGMTRTGCAYLRPTAGLPIKGTASGYVLGLTAKPTHSVPTPTASDHITRKCTSQESPLNFETNKSVTLDRWVQMWPTPAARDYRSPNKLPYSERGGGKKGEQLPNAVGGQLNPPWVEWLMGWPIGWTALEPLEMARFHEWLQQHSPSSPVSGEVAA